MTAKRLSSAYSLVRLLGSLTTMAVGAGCAETDTDPPVGTDGGTPPAVDGGLTDASVRECEITQEGTTRPCTCAAGQPNGSQACLLGKYQECRCTPVDAGGPAGSLCKGGFYSGEFTGKYKPGVFGFGLVMSFFEVDIAGAPSGSYPALSLTLKEQSTGGGEFKSFTVEGGCLIGSAQAVGTNNPFVARLTGALNCGTGKFTGEIAGQYNLLETGAQFNFRGPIEAQFQLPQNRLTDGVWNVQEPDALLGEPAGGGGGTWSAIWDSDTSPVSGQDPCAVLDAMDAGAAPTTDAGSTGTPDAGVDGG